MLRPRICDARTRDQLDVVASLTDGDTPLPSGLKQSPSLSVMHVTQHINRRCQGILQMDLTTFRLLAKTVARSAKSSAKACEPTAIRSRGAAGIEIELTGQQRADATPVPSPPWWHPFVAGRNQSVLHLSTSEVNVATPWIGSKSRAAPLATQLNRSSSRSRQLRMVLTQMALRLVR